MMTEFASRLVECGGRSPLSHLTGINYYPDDAPWLCSTHLPCLAVTSDDHGLASVFMSFLLPTLAMLHIRR